MKLQYIPLCVAALAAVSIFAGASASASETVLEEVSADLRNQVESVVETVKPALVRIQVVTMRYRDGRVQRHSSFGSGVIVSKEGHIVTNHHVAAHASHIKCTLTTKEEIEAELVGTDALTDMAVLKLENDGSREFPTAEWGDSEAIEVGDYVLAMGSPMALSQSVTKGIISNTEMIMPQQMRGRGALRLDGEDVGSLVRWIGHDAAIFPGNSGGPLVNLEGEIIGINEIQMSLGGAIPANLAQQVAQELIEDGEVRRSWLGIQVQPLLRHWDHDRGVLIGGVLDGGPAQQAGIEAGDLIVELAGEETEVRFHEELPLFNQLVADLPIGEEVDVVILRDGEEKTLTVVTEKREPVSPDQHELRNWGMTVRNVSLIMAKERRRDNQDGVYVTSLRSGGPVGEAQPSLRDSDIITRVNGVTISGVEELQSVTELIVEDAEEPVPTLVTFDRRGEEHITVVKVGMREIDQPGRQVRRAWLPVETQVITRDIAEQMDREDLRGFRVTRVFPGTAAEESDLRVGDFILAVDDMSMEASRPEDYEELAATIRQYRADTEAELTVLRDDEEITVSITLPLAPKPPREMLRYENVDFELTVRDLAFMDRMEKQWDDDVEGVLVDDVSSGGWADLGGIESGDLIMRVEDHEVSDVESMQEVMDLLTSEEPDAVVIKVLRDIYTRFIEIEPRWDETV